MTKPSFTWALGSGSCCRRARNWSTSIRVRCGPHPPGRGKPRIYDGRDLAQTALTVSESSPDEFTGFLRPEDRHRYVMIRYKNGIEVPSWALSDGTLRLLA